jgi:hypothetical protein
MSLTGPRHTAPSGGAASPTGMPRHDSVTEPGTEWQSDSHRASGRTCRIMCHVAASLRQHTRGLKDTFKASFLTTVIVICLLPL